MTLSPTGLIRKWERLAANNFIGFVDETLRGIGQVMFQNSPITGLLFLIGLFGGSWDFGLYALLGTVVSTFTAHWLGIQSGAIKAGLYGYNGTLVGVAFAFYLERNWTLLVYVILASCTVAIVSGAIGNLLGTWSVPALTAPFVVTTMLFVLGIFTFGEVRPSGNSQLPAFPSIAAPGRDSFSLSDFWNGIDRGVSQVFFQDKIWIGIIFLVAIFANSHIDCLMAIVGSVVGLAAAWALGASSDSITLGLQGYNSVLAMMAIAGLFYVLEMRSFVVGILAAAVAVVVAAAIGAIVAPYGGQIYTAPFVLTTWAFIAAKPFLTKLQAVAPADATTPEGNLNVYRRGGHWWERRDS